MISIIGVTHIYNDKTKKALKLLILLAFKAFARWVNTNIIIKNMSREKGIKILESRNIQQMFKVSISERQELQEIMREYNLSLSDVIRKAIKEVYCLQGFDPSYEIASNREVKRNKKWELY